MSAAAKKGCTTAGHDGFPPVSIPDCSPNVNINGVGAVTVGHNSVSHSKPDNPPHAVTVSSGSATVFVNGKPLAKMGSACGCGDKIAGGCSGNVNVG